ncbi:MAG: TAXI family TRAP transporter solute-binding subunit, partial [bacterium]|nr:TAXI family TRAP transporter solute-binding subunit [bacterium]
MKKALVVLPILTLVGALILFGCAQPTPAPAPAPSPSPSPAKPTAPAPPVPAPAAKNWPTFVTISAPPGGNQKVSIGLASLIKSELGISATVSTAQLGPAEYARVVHRGESEVALIASDVAYDSIRGTGVFSGEGKHRLRQILLNTWNPVLLMARTASGVKSVPDMRGKRFIFISKTVPYYTQMGDALLEYNKMTRKEIIPLEMAAGGDVEAALAAGTADVGTRMAAPGAAFIMQLVESTPITFIPLSQGELEFLQKKHPFF